MFLKFEWKSRYFFFILKSKSFQFFCKATLITSTDDGDLLQKVIDSNHYLYYIMLQSSMGGSGAEDVVVSDAAPWWQTTLRALDVVFCALAVAAVVMYVLHTYTDVFSEEKRKNRAAKKN